MTQGAFMLLKQEWIYSSLIQGGLTHLGEVELRHHQAELVLPVVGPPWFLLWVAVLSHSSCTLYIKQCRIRTSQIKWQSGLMLNSISSSPQITLHGMEVLSDLWPGCSLQFWRDIREIEIVDLPLAHITGGSGLFKLYC